MATGFVNDLNNKKYRLQENIDDAAQLLEMLKEELKNKET